MKTTKLDPALQRDLLGRPLRCLEGVSLENLTMNDGLELIQKIHDEINGYLGESPIAQNLAYQFATRQKKVANLSIFVDLEIGIVADAKPTTKPKKQQAEPPKPKTEPTPTTNDPFELVEDDTEIDLLLQEAQDRGVSLRGVPKTVEAVREHLASSSGESIDSSISLNPFEEDLPIIQPTKPRPPRVLNMTATKAKKPSRMERLVALAQSRDLGELEQFASKKLGVEDTDDT